MSKLDRMGGPPGRVAHNRKSHDGQTYNGWRCIELDHFYAGHQYWKTEGPNGEKKVQDVNNRKVWVAVGSQSKTG
jgi:hypothetical protein